MEALLDPASDASDPNLIDRVVATAYSGPGEEPKKAMAILTEFQNQPESWQRVPGILDNSQSQQAKVGIGLLSAPWETS